ncbi:hypothetical protein [Variovorax sp. UMC13]|uniref:hypothetical protein n=1 Tax=Variovorax sp. UMC13 TaxID=1862326 RepID=UPI001602E601|nr:hypothetical protein [Variovorax sp. UMC13]MBB1599988.1 hypothetical protein [Variovorax sp. UMC13]
MNVYEASANMIAFSEFMVAAVKSTYGDAAEAHAEVAGFEHGSFVTDLVFTVGGSAATVFTALTPAQLWDVVKGAFDLWKHLKGSPPAAIKHDGQSVTVTNNSGHIIQVRTDSLTLVLNEKASEAVEQFVKVGLSHEGYEALRIGGATEVPAITVDRREAESFVPVAAKSQLSDNTVEVALTIVAAVFQDGNKWRFNDGASTFNAALTDGDFLIRVEKGERFGKGDVLRVRMQVVQSRTGAKVSVERTVLKVLDHLTPHEQAVLLPG